MAAFPINPCYEESRLYEMAALMATDNDFAVFKTFSKLNFLNILHLQHGLTELEKKLCDALENGCDVRGIIIEIRKGLKEYNAAFLSLSAMKDTSKPSDKTLFVIERFSDSHLREFRKELQGADGVTDNSLMSLAVADKSWILNLVDDHPALQKLFQLKGPEKDTIGIRYISNSLVKSVLPKLERFLVTIGFCCLLLGPIYGLSYVHAVATKLSIVASSVVSVSLFTAALTRARNWEILTVTAGYCAILVVFLDAGLDSTLK